MIRTHKFSTNLSGVIFLLFLIEAIAAQSSNLQTFTESEQSDESGQNSIPKKINENEREFSENETIEKYRLAIIVTPENALLHNNLGVQYALIYRYEEAYKALKKSIELDSNSANTYYNLSKVTEFLGRFPEAVEFARQAITLDKEHKKSNNQLCRLLAISESDDKAVKCYENYFTDFTPDADITAGYGIALINSGDLKKAAAVLEAESKFSADNKSMQNALGVLYFTKKKYKRAAKYFTRAIELAPNYQAAHFNLAIAQFNRKDRQGAFDQYVILKKSNVKLARKLYRYMYADKVLSVGGK